MADLILVVDDEDDVATLIARHLRQAGYGTVTAADSQSALAVLSTATPALIVLDWMLPDVDGIELTRRLKADVRTKAIPIVMVTARGSEADRIFGFESGADDYVTKPFSARELVLRVKRILQHRPPAEVVKIGPMLIDWARHHVAINGRSVDLTVTEFRLLRAFVQRAGRVQTRNELLSTIYDPEHTIESRTIDAHVRRLRDKLGHGGEFIETVRGVGYRFADEY